MNDPGFDRVSLIPTLLVNHQLRDETLAAINIIPTKHSYELDLMIVNEETLWPTWLVVPEYTTRVDAVHATVRIVGTKPASSRQSGFQFDGENPPVIVWCFLSVLERFLCKGPVGEQPPEDSENEVDNIGAQKLQNKGTGIQYLEGFPSGRLRIGRVEEEQNNESLKSDSEDSSLEDVQDRRITIQNLQLNFVMPDVPNI